MSAGLGRGHPACGRPSCARTNTAELDAAPLKRQSAAEARKTRKAYPLWCRCNGSNMLFSWRCFHGFPLKAADYFRRHATVKHRRLQRLRMNRACMESMRKRIGAARLMQRRSSKCLPGCVDCRASRCCACLQCRKRNDQGSARGSFGRGSAKICTPSNPPPFMPAL